MHHFMTANANVMLDGPTLRTAVAKLRHMCPIPWATDLGPVGVANGRLWRSGEAQGLYLLLT